MSYQIRIYPGDDSSALTPKSPEPPQIKKQIQAKIEIEFLHSFTLDKFPEKDVEKIKQAFPKIDLKRIDEILSSDNFVNYYFHYYLQIIIMIITQSPEKYKDDAIFSYFANLKVLGTESVEGFVAFPYFGGNDLVIKIPRGNSTDIDHEAFIGLVALNQMRKIVPNFTYSYALFNCSSPIIMDNSNINNWCDEKGRQNDYFVMENIKNSVSFRKMLSMNNPELMMNLLFQIFQALLLGKNKFNYQHNDLHYENIMVRELKMKNYINYNAQNFKYHGSLFCSHIAMIIDYGFNSIKLKTGSAPIGFGLYGRGFEYEYGIAGNEIYECSDIYKLICFSGLALKNYGLLGSLSFKILSDLFVFFGSNLGGRIIEYESRNDDYFQASKAFQGQWSLDRFVDYAHDIFTRYGFKMSSGGLSPESPRGFSVDEFIDAVTGNLKSTLLTSCVFGEQVSDKKRLLAEIAKRDRELDNLGLVINRDLNNSRIINAKSVSPEYISFLNHISEYLKYKRENEIDIETLKCSGETDDIIGKQNVLPRGVKNTLEKNLREISFTRDTLKYQVMIKDLLGKI